MMELRDYQKTAVAETKTALARYRRVVLQLPTGAGKGVILGDIASMCRAKGNSVLILAHSEEILKQDASHCRRWGADTGIVFAKTKRIPSEQCVCMMAQTLRQRVRKNDWLCWFKSFPMVICDECHRAEFDFVFDILPKKSFVLGLSASPARYGAQKQLGLEYNALVTGPSVKNLVERGFLCGCRLFSLDAPKLDDVEWSSSRGDYVLSQMADRFKSKARYVGAVENYKRICNGAKCLVFCCSSEQTIEVTRAFNDAGIRAKYCLSSDFDEDVEYSGDRMEVIDGFGRGEFPVLVNYGILTTGIDQPDIKAVMLLFATTSVVKYLQCLGRASRTAEGKNGEFICMDFGTNYERLGRYEDDREWGLWHNTGAGGGVAPTKLCPQCGRMIPVQMMDCCFCGYHFPTRQEVYTAELEEIASKEATGQDGTLEQWVAAKKLSGWSTNRILVNVCIRNPENKKQAFMKAISILRTKDGNEISPKYWYFFSKNILPKVKALNAADNSQLNLFQQYD